MNRIYLDMLIQRLGSTNAYLLKVTVDLTDEQLGKQLSPSSPPIGWHLWHIARWADRFQASFHDRQGGPTHSPVPEHNIWHTENFPAQWGLTPTRLGVLEAGGGMDHGAAAALPQIAGKQNLLAYARRVFAASEQALNDLKAEELEKPRTSIREFEVIDNLMRHAAAKETTHVADIMFHIIHANRHLGMIEALRGLLGLNGSASG